jgi:hypothetical protein
MMSEDAGMRIWMFAFVAAVAFGRAQTLVQLQIEPRATQRPRPARLPIHTVAVSPGEKPRPDS